MKIKRYFGPDTRQTMKQIRAEQGPDAVILCCRSTAGGTEIVTAVEPDKEIMARTEPKAARPRPQMPAGVTGTGQLDSPPQPKAQAKASAKAPARPRVEPQRTIASAESDTVAEIQAIRRELRAMQGLLDDRFSKLTEIDFQRRQPFESSLLTKLTDHGIDPRIGRNLIHNLPAGDPRKAWNEVLVRLSRQIRTTNDDILRRGGKVVLMGPAGVGKTTTIAKLATRYMLRHGRDEVALIANDHSRVGGLQQLQRYAQILQIPLWSARNPKQLLQALDAFSDRSLVLIDSAGLGHSHPKVIDQLKMFARIPSLRRYLVATATVSSEVFEQVLTRYSLADLSGIILTHVDEANRLGGILSTAHEHQIPFAYLANGMRVPEDLTPARAARLVAAAVSVNNKLPAEAAVPKRKTAELNHA
ncbi:MAG: flagellar biosynthesis protein FlhF [Xanthomonadales bacterium]|nr:flagellar biosynthesis protein FlhF [Xanthomonadales bacterium]